MKRVKWASLISVLMGLAIILSTSAAFAASSAKDSESMWQLGVGLWSPKDSAIFDGGTAFWGAMQGNNLALRFGIGTADWANIEGAPGLTSLELAAEYRFMSPAKAQQKVKWYAGAGLALSSLSTDLDGVTYTDNAIGPCISLGLTAGKLGVDLHSYWGEDSVDIGGTILSVSYSF